MSLLSLLAWSLAPGAGAVLAVQNLLADVAAVAALKATRVGVAPAEACDLGDVGRRRLGKAFCDDGWEERGGEEEWRATRMRRHRSSARRRVAGARTAPSLFRNYSVRAPAASYGSAALKYADTKMV